MSKPVKRFVILAAPRTGSNMLCTMMQSHPDVLCHHEIFNPRDCYYALPLRNNSFHLGSVEERDNDPLAFLDRVWENCFHYQCIGFKMTLFQQPKILQTICEDASIHKIILKRRANLRTYVSRLIAEKNDVWEDYRSEDVLTPPSSVFVDYQNLKSSINDNHKFYLYLDKMIIGPSTNIEYESLFVQEERNRLLDEMGLKIHTLKEQSRQQNPYKLSRLVENKYQLIEIFESNTEDEDLLHELVS